MIKCFISIVILFSGGLLYGQNMMDISGSIKIGSSGQDSAQAGMVRWNEDLGDFEGYNGSKWVSLTNSRNAEWGVSPGRLANLEETGDNANENLGASVCINSKSIFVGKPGAFNGVGSVIQYDYDDIGATRRNVFVEQRGSLDAFGSSCACNENWLIIGAPSVNRAYIYKYEPMNNNWTLSDSLGHEASLALGANDAFGNAVTINDSRAFVSSSTTQRVYVFTLDGNKWLYQYTIIPGANQNGGFGRKLAVDNGNLYISAPTAGSFAEGQVYEYSESLFPTSWNVSYTFKDTSANPGFLDEFGDDFKVHNGRILITVSGSTKVFSFRRFLISGWELIETKGIEGLTGNFIPISDAIGLYGDISVINDVNGPSLYKLVDNKLQRQVSLTSRNIEQETNLTNIVSHENVIVVTQADYFEGNVPNVGLIRIYLK